MSLRNLRAGERGVIYIPTLVAVANINGIPTLLSAFYGITGKHVTVSLMVTANIDVNSAATSFSVTLPFGKRVTAIEDIIGGASEAWGLGGPAASGSFSGNVLGHTDGSNTALVSLVPFPELPVPKDMNISAVFNYLAD